jgi:hypothetical protein
MHAHLAPYLGVVRRAAARGAIIGLAPRKAEVLAAVKAAMLRYRYRVKEELIVGDRYSSPQRLQRDANLSVIVFPVWVGLCSLIVPPSVFGEAHALKKSPFVLAFRLHELPYQLQEQMGHSPLSTSTFERPAASLNNRSSPSLRLLSRASCSALLVASIHRIKLVPV